VQGELLLAQRGSRAATETEASFRRAIELARGQRAFLWELRATVSLCRQRRGDEVRAALAAICRRFPTPCRLSDLDDARALLAPRA
jgi:predicted ATPase